MATETIYIVQTWQAGKRGALVADPPQQYKAADEAARRAERMVDSVAGVMAYSMDIDADGGDYGTPRVLFSAGAVPEMG